jgi:hypothetical protein
VHAVRLPAEEEEEDEGEEEASRIIEQNSVTVKVIHDVVSSHNYVVSLTTVRQSVRSNADTSRQT